MRRWAWSAVTIALWGCGESAPTTGADASTDVGPSGFVVDVAGGSFTVDGVRFAFPAGAVDRRVEIRVTSTDGPAPAGYALRSRLYRFEPEGTTFASPVQVTIPFTGELGIGGLYWSTASGGYERLASVTSGATLTASITHFSTGFVGVPLSVDAGDAATDVTDATVDISDVGADAAADATTDATTDATVDAATDVGADVTADAGIDAATDTGTDAGSAPDVPLGMVTPPRPLLPRTGARALSNRPLVRWALPTGVMGARLTFCRDRAMSSGCVSADVTGDQGQPTAALSAGVWFWGLQGRNGAVVGAQRSAVWRLTVPSIAGSAQGQYGGEYDANGDGYADLALADATGARVLLGGASGLTATATVTLSVPFDATNFGRAVASGDFDRDGYVDLAISANAIVYVYQGGPSGPRTTPALTVRGADTFGDALATGDVNGDGYADLLVSGAFLFAGSATGLPVMPGTITPSRQVLRLAGDLNGDGYEDLIGNTSTCQVWLSSASGLAASGMSVGATICAPIGDTENDGYADLVVGGEVWRGGAAGVTNSTVTDARYRLASVPQTRDAVVADIDGDGDDDVFVTTTGAVVRGEAVGARSVIDGWTPPESTGYAQPAGDLNGDGLPDWSAGSRVHYSSPSAAPGQRWLALAAPAQISLVSAPGDLDGDGREELAVSSVMTGSGTFVYEGTSAGFGATPTMTTVAPRAVGDLDGDTFGEVATPTGVGTVRVVFGAVTGPSARTADLTVAGATGSASAFRVGDVTGDGRGDVLVRTNASRLSLFRGAMAGVNTTPTAVSITLPTSYSLTEVRDVFRVGDVNGDGASDAVLWVGVERSSERLGGLVPCFGGAGGLTCNGAAVFQRSSFTQESGAAVIGDVTGDGRPEVFFDRRVFRFVSGAWSALSSDNAASAVCGPIGDRNGDGLDDVALYDAMGVRVFAGSATSGVSATLLETYPHNFPVLTSLPTCASVDDRDGDGRREILLANDPSAQMYYSAPGGAWAPIP